MSKSKIRTLSPAVISAIAVATAVAASAPIARADAISSWDDSYSQTQPTSESAQARQDERREALRRKADQEHKALVRAREVEEKRAKLETLKDQETRLETELDESEARMKTLAGEVQTREERDPPNLFTRLFGSTPPDSSELKDETARARKLRDELKTRNAEIVRLEKEIKSIHGYTSLLVTETDRERQATERATAHLSTSGLAQDRQLALMSRVQADTSYYQARGLKIDADFAMQDTQKLHLKYGIQQARLDQIEKSVDLELNQSMMGRYILRLVRSEVAKGCDLKETRCAITGAGDLNRDVNTGVKGGTQGDSCWDLDDATGGGSFKPGKGNKGADDRLPPLDGGQTGQFDPPLGKPSPVDGSGKPSKGTSTPLDPTLRDANGNPIPTDSFGG